MKRSATTTKTTFGRESAAAKNDRAQVIDGLLERYYPNADCALVHKNAFELLIATVLSAQCTDARVNQVTPGLFSRFPSPDLMAKAKVAELENLVRPTGFFRAKAKSLLAISQDLQLHHAGRVPESLEQLIKLRGVGRKTANVVLGVIYGRAEGIVVDTHVRRLSQRLGLTKSADPVVIEQDLMKLINPKRWIQFSHCLILHGRQVCAARKPKCHVCFLADICPTGKKQLALSRSC